MTVIMRHPTLPPEQEIEVDDGAVPHHANAGWIAVPDEELEARAAAKAKATAEAVAAARGDQEPPEAAAAEELAGTAAEATGDMPIPARSRAKSAEKKGE